MQKSKKKKTKVRDLKPKKDPKGGWNPQPDPPGGKVAPPC